MMPAFFIEATMQILAAFGLFATELERAASGRIQRAWPGATKFYCTAALMR
jgi:drug/metabolite transporter superfamily protein YnfA